MEQKFGWSWGGFLSPFLFCLRFSLWIPLLLCFVPALNGILYIVMGFKGREMAWQTGRFQDPFEFMETQKKWDKILTVVFFISILPVILFWVAIFGLFF